MKENMSSTLQDHKSCGEMTEIEAKVKYVKLARSLRTYGVSFFLVKVRSSRSSSMHDLTDGSFPSIQAVFLHVYLDTLFLAVNNIPV